MNTNENSSIESAASALTLKGTVGFLALIGFFTVTIELQEGESQRSENVIGGRKMTYIRITIQAGKRGLFAKNANDVAPQVLSGLRRYLMINDETCRLKSVDPAVTKPGRR